MTMLHQRVARNNVFRSGERFLSSLEEAVLERGRYIDTQPRRLRMAEIHDAYMRARQRVLILDYDGTLVPFVKRPQQAVPPNRLLDLLSTLAADSRNCLALISGRSTENLDRWFGSVHGLWLAAEHGAELKASSAEAWEPLRPEVPSDWKSSVMPILEHFMDRTPGSYVEEKKYALVWHYRMAEPEFGEWLANELVSMLEAMLAETELRAFRGEKIVEVKPVWANKGDVLCRLLAAYPRARLHLCGGRRFTSVPVPPELHTSYRISKAYARCCGPSPVSKKPEKHLDSFAAKAPEHQEERDDASWC
jgi:trehalose 6-phosphate synthase/phosphatase